MNLAFGNVLGFARVWGTGRFLGNSSEIYAGSRTPCYSAEMNSLFLSGASFLMKLQKKNYPYNLIYVSFCQLWFILLLLLVYFLGGFWLLSFWTEARKLRASLTLTCQVEWRKPAPSFYISECLGWRRLYPSLVRKCLVSFYVKAGQAFKVQSAAQRPCSPLCLLSTYHVLESPFSTPSFWLYSQIRVLDTGTPQLP